MRVETVELAVFGEPGFTTNSYLVYDEKFPEQLLVVDPADDYERLKAAIGNRKVAGIVCTHSHFDHVGALAQLEAASHAPIYAHRIEARAVVATVTALAVKRNQPEPKLKVKYLVEEGDWITIGSDSWQVLYTPGHTQGCICLLATSSNSLISGDTLFFESFGRTDLPTGNDKDMLQSLKRLATLEPSIVVYPGHGPTTTIGHECLHGALNPRFWR